MKSKLVLRYGAVLAFLFVGMMPAYADAVFTLGNQSMQDEENILFETSQIGRVIYGFTDRTDSQIQFVSSEILVVTAGGQEITGQNGLIDFLRISAPGSQGFKGFVIDPFNPVTNNDLFVFVFMTDGSGFGFHGYGETNSDNFLTITTANDELISYIEIVSRDGFEGLRQPQIAGLVAIPEPSTSTLLLMSGGLLAFTGKLRRGCGQRQDCHSQHK
jgi:hypothetical protein